MEQILDVTLENDPLVIGDCSVMPALYFNNEDLELESFALTIFIL